MTSEESKLLFAKLTKYFLFIVIAALLIVITFKNGSINRLKKKLDEKPRVEYIRKDTTIYKKGDLVPVPYKVEVPDSVPYEVEKFLTTADSAKIAAEYSKIFIKFNSVSSYEKTYMDDSTAFIHVKEDITQNRPFNQVMTFKDRRPTRYVTTTVKSVEKTFSLSGGLEAGTSGVEVGAGLVDYSNRFYKISYNPFDGSVKGAVYIPIFNFRSKR